MEKLIDGRKLSKTIKEEVRKKTAELIIEKNVKPGLAILLVGDNPASLSYVRSKERNSENMDFHFVMEKMPDTATEDEVLNIINTWNSDDKIHGILVQLPLPDHIDENKIILTVDPDKDVDGFHPLNMGRLVIGLDGMVPCTPAGIFEMIKRSNIETQGKHLVVLGRSNIVGKPIANLMYQHRDHANATVTICHSHSGNSFEYTKQADIIISAVGKPQFIKSQHIKEGAVIIDVGINRIDADNEKGYKIVGDVDFENVKDKVSAITPVPGGVGPMTIAMLMSNTYRSAERKTKANT